MRAGSIGTLAPRRYFSCNSQSAIEFTFIV
jgi:hypothetical protein